MWLYDKSQLGIWHNVFSIVGGVFGIWDGVFDNWNGKFDLWGGVFDIIWMWPIHDHMKEW